MWIQAPCWPNEEFSSLQSWYIVFFLEFYSVKCNKLMCQALSWEFDDTLLPPSEHFRNYSAIDFFSGSLSSIVVVTELLHYFNSAHVDTFT